MSDGLQVVVLEMRHLEVRSEDRRQQRDGVAGIEQPVGLHRLEDVAHRGRAAFDGVQVEAALRPRRTAHRPLQILVDDLLVVHEHAIGHRIVVADDRIDELVDESIGIELEFLHGPRHERGEKFGARKIAVLLQPRGEPLSGAALRGHSADTGRKIEHALAFRDRILPEQEKCLARLGRDPIGVTAARIQIRARRRGRALARSLRQKVLDLERTQRFVFAQIDDVHAGSPTAGMISQVALSAYRPKGHFASRPRGGVTSAP